MSGLLIRGEEVAVDTVTTPVLNRHDDPRLVLSPGDHRKRRAYPVRAIVLHTTRGIPGVGSRREQTILAGFGPDVEAERKVARYWSTDGRSAGAHIVVDADGSIGCLADLQDHCAFHAGTVNDRVIGIELYQSRRGELYQAQLEVTVRLIDFLTRAFSIQRQVAWPYHGRPIARGLSGGRDMVGIYGHREASSARGRGDPGDRIMEMLIGVGYEPVDMDADEDLERWKGRQRDLGCVSVDGIPGPKTCAALRDIGHRHGLLVSRPGD